MKFIITVLYSFIAIFVLSIFLSIFQASAEPEALKVKVQPKPNPTPVILAASLNPPVKKATPCQTATGFRGTVIAKYHVTCSDDGRYLIPPLTDRRMSLSERLEVITLLALNEGIPPDLLKGICWVEGWDLYTNQRCQMWYGNGLPVKSVTGALGAMQVSPKWHPESDAFRLGNDFSYNLSESVRVLVSGLPKPSSTQPRLWSAQVMSYGDRRIANQYWTSVITAVENPPINPETNQPAW